VTDWLYPLQFREPWYLLAAAAALAVYAAGRFGGGRILFSSLSLLPGEVGWRARLDPVPDACLGLAAVAFAVALAGPRIPDADSRVRSEGIAIMMVVDISSSMRALDLSTETEDRTRLEAAVDVFSRFVRGAGDLPGRRDDTVGLISFAGHAETRCPLTLDHRSLLTVAEDLEIVSRAEDDGTALGDGLGLAALRLRHARATSRVAIVLTDGVHNAGVESPQTAAALARESGIKVYTIGAGTNGFARMEVHDPFTGGLRMVSVPVEIDEETLTEVAEATGGRYFRATDSEALAAVYREIDRLERTELEETVYARHDDYYWLALAIGLALAALGFTLRSTVWRRLP
jgi:Ca-activated chloride channel family protein